MRTVLLALGAVLALAAPSASAQFNPDRGAGVAGAASGVTTAAAARAAPDETPVVLTGRIVERIRSETYRFVDDSGEVRLDIGEEIWGGVEVGPHDQVRVTGEVDRGLGRMDVWVRSIERLD